jgi:integrase
MTWVRTKTGGFWKKMHRGRVYTVSPLQLREYFKDPTIPATKEGSWTKANLWWQQQEAALDQEHYRGPVQTVQEALERFLSLKRSQVGIALSPHYYGHLSAFLTRFLNYAGPGTLLSQVGATSFQGFYTYCLGQIQSGHWSRKTAQEAFVAARSFLRWCFENELMDLPRNINSRDFSFRVAPSPITTWTVEEYKLAVNSAPLPLVLFLLLGTNCGMLPVDMGSLRDEEVDWEHGRITRKRTKTRHVQAVPTVSYLLWPDTFTYLKLRRSGGPLVLLTETGTTLTRASLTPDGRVSHTNNPNTMWYRFRSKIGISKPLKQLRKLGASLIGSHPVYGRLAPLYLGHSPRGMAERYYLQTPQALLDEAVTWLGQQLGQVQ